MAKQCGIPRHYDRERKNQKGRVEILIQMSSNESMEQPPQLCC